MTAAQLETLVGKLETGQIPLEDEATLVRSVAAEIRALPAGPAAEELQRRLDARHQPRADPVAPPPKVSPHLETLLANLEAGEVPWEDEPAVVRSAAAMIRALPPDLLTLDLRRRFLECRARMHRLPLPSADD